MGPRRGGTAVEIPPSIVLKTTTEILFWPALSFAIRFADSTKPDRRRSRRRRRSSAHSAPKPRENRFQKRFNRRN